ncbi:MAG: NAD(P)H-dependent oxidoreductase [Deltaproteobacteria bacterium]|nr:NAD(P)H-dependent oxidoreductase [Deltaproteobacteria bacterium]
MKVLAINSSPRITGQSKTELLMSHLVSGMEAAGAQVDVVHLRTKKVRNCIGCFTCWTKTPGRCIHQDDMTGELFPKFIASNLAVLATPLYHFTMNASMKAFVERTLPVLEPTLVRKGDITYHPLRGPHPGIVALSVAGFPEISVFDQLSAHLRFMYKQGLLGEIYRPGAEAMVQPVFRKVCDDVLDAVSQAGKELVKSLKISPETMERITQPICDFELMARASNIFWKTCIAQGVTPEELKAKSLVPRPESVEDFMGLMQMAFRPELAGDVSAVIQFAFTGLLSGSCFFTIGDGVIDASPGTSPLPALTIETPFDLWMDVLTGKADGQKAFMDGKYRATGDLTWLVRMKEMFGSSNVGG